MPILEQEVRKTLAFLQVVLLLLYYANAVSLQLQTFPFQQKLMHVLGRILVFLTYLPTYTGIANTLLSESGVHSVLQCTVFLAFRLNLCNLTRENNIAMHYLFIQ